MTCTLFDSISVACYCVLCVTGVGCLDHSLPFACNRNRSQGVSDVGAWNEKQGRWIRALWQLMYQVSNVNKSSLKKQQLQSCSSCKTHTIVESKSRKLHHSSREIKVRFLGYLHFSGTVYDSSSSSCGIVSSLWSLSKSIWMALGSFYFPVTSLFLEFTLSLF